MNKPVAIGARVDSGRRLMPDQRGQGLVEFALTLWLFLMTVLGTAVVGLVVFRYNMVSDLAQEGARRAAVCGRNRSLALDCDVPNFVQSRSLGIGVNVTVSPAVGAGTTLSSGDTVTVTVQHTFTRMTRVLPLADLNLTSTAQMIVAR